MTSAPQHRHYRIILVLQALKEGWAPRGPWHHLFLPAGRERRGQRLCSLLALILVDCLCKSRPRPKWWHPMGSQVVKCKGLWLSMWGRGIRAGQALVGLGAMVIMIAMLRIRTNNGDWWNRLSLMSCVPPPRPSLVKLYATPICLEAAVFHLFEVVSGSGSVAGGSCFFTLRVSALVLNIVANSA
jgi:hypothetical protein